MAETKKYVRIKKASVDGVWYADKIGNVYEVDRENCVSILTKRGIRGLSSVLREDAELIVTEKRPAKVGERVLITVAAPIGKQAYETGDVFVAESLYDPFAKDIRVLGIPDFIDYNEYEVIVDNELKNGEADGMESTYVRKQSEGLDRVAKSLGYVELAKSSLKQNGFIGEVHTFDLLTECAERLREQAQTHKEKIERGYPEFSPVHKSAQARRDEIVEQAKADVERLRENNIRLRTFNISLEVNRKDRSVEAIAKRPKSNRAFYGIAKAAPSDCFNVHIGKAIALRRALGLGVPDEYLNAPQPAEVRVGDVVYGKYSEAYYQLWCEDEIGDVSYEVKIKEIVDGKYRYVGGGYDFIDDADLTIIDDSREGVVGE
ncbi:hypothetical protein P9D14_13055 [Bacillus velezensis]|uniref:hypothetical protein n=1 Tax=Bacillus velezensis TaxID=492670 RepID=UPI002DB65E6D|nr:hypothetical protein [Bacillus velezensis]MEC1384446.1 hypothetical protein [Bacillus velezensis]